MKKLNKKGFTLIELLAVIAILAILLLLVTPNILKMFNQGKEDAFSTQVQSIYKAAEQQYVTDSMTGTPGPYCSNNVDSTFKTSENCKPLEISGSSSNLQYYVKFVDGTINNLVVFDGQYGYISTVKPAINEVSTKSSDKHTYIKEINDNTLKIKAGSTTGTYVIGTITSTQNS